VNPWMTRGIFALLALGGGAFAYMQLVKAGFVKYNRWDHRDRGRLRKGDPTPDLTLSLYQGGSVALSSLWRDKPVFIVFGSCT